MLALPDPSSYVLFMSIATAIHSPQLTPTDAVTNHGPSNTTSCSRDYALGQVMARHEAVCPCCGRPKKAQMSNQSRDHQVTSRRVLSS